MNNSERQAFLMLVLRALVEYNKLNVDDDFKFSSKLSEKDYNDLWQEDMEQLLADINGSQYHFRNVLEAEAEAAAFNQHNVVIEEEPL